MTRDRRSAPQQSPNFVWEALEAQTPEAGPTLGPEGVPGAAEAAGGGGEPEHDARREPGARRTSGRALIAAAVLVPLAGAAYAAVALSSGHDDTAVVTALASQAPDIDAAAGASPAAAPPRARLERESDPEPEPEPELEDRSLSVAEQDRDGGGRLDPGSSALTTTLAVAPGRTVAASAGVPTAAASHTATKPAGPPTGTIVGYEGLCLDDRGAIVANYNPVQVHTCNNTDAQHWTLESNGTIEVFGMCLDVYAAGTAGGTRVDLYQCNGTNAQTWVPQSDGALVNPESGQCLDDTEFGGTGTQVEIWTCNGGSDQVWRLP